MSQKMKISRLLTNFYCKPTIYPKDKAQSGLFFVGKMSRETHRPNKPEPVPYKRSTLSGEVNFQLLESGIVSQHGTIDIKGCLLKPTINNNQLDLAKEVTDEEGIFGANKLVSDDYSEDSRP